MLLGSTTYTFGCQQTPGPIPTQDESAATRTPTPPPTTMPDPSPLATESALPTPPVHPRLENGQEIQLTVDERLFTLLCAWNEVLHGYEALIPTAVEACNTYLRLEEAPLSKPLGVAPTLLLARGCGLNRQTKDTIFIVLGPTQKPSPMLLQHEYLHQVVGPMIDAQDEALSESEALFESVYAEDDVFSNYGSRSSVVEESLLRVLPLRLPAQRDYDEAKQFIEKQERKGFLLMGTYYEALEAYEA